MKRMKLKRFLMCITLIIVSVLSYSSIVCYHSCQSGNNNFKDSIFDAVEKNDSNMNLLAEMENKAANIKNDLVNAVSDYIFDVTKKRANKNIPQHIVDNALEHDIDICFMMAQTEIETCYGTTGAGRESSRRSLFGVSKRRYNTYEDAISDYILLLKKDYLVKGRDEQYLMKNYVNKGGHRYAGSLSYENDLRRAYNKIVKKTNINELQEKYNNV